MSKYMALRLFAPFQSWGNNTSLYNFRHTSEFPTKSALYGMFCAAFGYDRGSSEEAELLKQINPFIMTAFKLFHKSEPTIYTDFQTAHGLLQANGKISENAELIYRDYLTDVSFGIILEGDAATINKVWDALHNPIHTLFLGRKCCMVLNPFTIGVFNTQKEAFEKIVEAEPYLDRRTKPKNLSECVYQKEVRTFSEGNDTLQDVPISFGDRVFATRRVSTKRQMAQTPF